MLIRPDSAKQFQGSLELLKIDPQIQNIYQPGPFVCTLTKVIGRQSVLSTNHSSIPGSPCPQA